MRIRQIALVARDLDPVAGDLCAVLGIEVAFHDPGVGEFGLHNAVMPVGDTFLEVVSPVRDGTTAGRDLERRGGDGGYMVILQTGDLAADRSRLAREGVRIVWEIALPDIATLHLHPRDLGGAIVSLDQPDPPPSWRWAGPGWQDSVRTERVRRIVGAEIQAADPEVTAARWARALGLEDREAGAGVREIPLDDGRLVFVADRDGRGDGLSALALAAADGEAVLAAARARGTPVDGDTVRIGGTRIDLLPPAGHA